MTILLSVALVKGSEDFVNLLGYPYKGSPFAELFKL